MQMRNISSGMHLALWKYGPWKDWANLPEHALRLVVDETGLDAKGRKRQGAKSVRGNLYSYEGIIEKNLLVGIHRLMPWDAWAELSWQRQKDFELYFQQRALLLQHLRWQEQKQYLLHQDYLGVESEMMKSLWQPQLTCFLYSDRRFQRDAQWDTRKRVNTPPGSIPSPIYRIDYQTWSRCWQWDERGFFMIAPAMVIPFLEAALKCQKGMAHAI